MNAARFIDQSDPSSWENIGSNSNPRLPVYSEQPSYGAVPQSPDTASSSLFGKVSTRQLMHILSAMLMISLCALVVELESPGVMTRVGRKVQVYLANSRRNYKSDMASDALKNHANSYYAPVPAPFLAPRVSKFVDFVPTSEPTIVRDSSGAFFSPTSEPTEYSDRSSIFSPTSEPTEYRGSTDEDYKFMASSLAASPSSATTSEPTMFNAGSASEVPTSEPTIFAGDFPQVQDNIPTSEPTLFARDIPEVQQENKPTSEPTILAGDIPEVQANPPTSEPTIFTGDIPEVPESTAVPTITSTGTSSENDSPDVNTPTSEPTIFTGDIPDVPESTTVPTTTSTGTSTGKNSQNVPVGTATPSDIIIEGPTSDPTQFPTPAPTEATLLGYIGESVGDMLESIF